MQHYIMVYLAIGTVFTILFDMLLRYSESDEPLVFWEFILSILFWPGVLAIFIKKAIEGDDH